MQQIDRSTHQATIHGDLAKLSGCKLTRHQRKSNGAKSPLSTPKKAPMDLSFILYALAALLVAAGMAGIILPAIPGVPLMYAGFLLAAGTDGFERIGWVPLLALGVLIWWSVGRGLAPIRQMTHSLAVRDAEDLTALDVSPDARELRPFALALNDLMSRLGAARRREAEFTAAAAHELEPVSVH